MELILCLVLGYILGSATIILLPRLLPHEEQASGVPFVGNREKETETLPTGVFFPSEEDTADFLNERMVLQDREIINPYRGWDIYDEKE